MRPPRAVVADTGLTNYRLPNGVEVVLEESHLAPVVALQAWVRVGAADEPSKHAGIAHIVEHMLFKGTATRKVGAVARAVEAAGGDINAWTSHDETAVHLVLPSDRLPLGIEILSDILQRSVFDPAEFESERKVVLEEVRQGQDEPDRLAGLGLFASAFRRHPYGRPVIGHPRTVAAISRADAVKFFKRYYGARNPTLVVAGDFSTRRAQALIRRGFAGMPPGRPTAMRLPEPPQKTARTTVVIRDVKESQILLAWPSPPINHDDLPALDVLAVALGQGESSRLHVELVRRRALVNGTSAYLFTGRDPGLLIASASLASSRKGLVGALEGLLGQIQALKQGVLSPEEIARSRTLLESQRVFDREAAQGLARKLGFFASTVGDVRFEERYLARLATVTSADIQRVARQHLGLQAVTVYGQTEGPPSQHGRVDAGLVRACEKVLAKMARQKVTPPPAEARTTKVVRRQQRSQRSAADVVAVSLDSGVRLLMLRDPSLPLVALRGAWVGGLRREDRATNGSSNLIASLLSRGTSTRDAETIARQVEGMAGSLSGQTGRNSLGLEAEFLTKHIDAGSALFVECLTDSVFPSRELQHERRLSLEALRQQQDDVGHVAFRAFERTLFGEHPYGLDLTGSVTSLRRLKREQLRQIYATHYDPSTLTIAAVGDIDIDGLSRRFDQAFPRRVPSGASRILPIGSAREARTQRIALVPLAREQAHLVLGFPGVTMADPDRYALELLAQALSGQGGRLFAEVREKHGLVYSIGAYSLEGLDPGYFAVHAATSPERAVTVVNYIREELARIRDDGMRSQLELKRVQRHLIGAHAIGLQRRSAVAATLAFREAYGLGWNSYREYPERIREVTVADVVRVARTYCDPDREILSVVGPQRALAAWDATETAQHQRGSDS